MHILLLATLANSRSERSCRGRTHSSSDHDLIHRIARADREAMRLLFQRFKTPVYRFALRLIADETAAEDIVSDVFLNVWRTAGAFEGRSTVSTWLLAMTRNKAIALMRRRPIEILDDDTAETSEDGSDSPETTLQKRQIRAILLEALKQLS
jgi:RNA polymerase sigma-70 factor, ECF subfamily